MLRTSVVFSVSKVKKVLNKGKKFSSEEHLIATIVMIYFLFLWHLGSISTTQWQKPQTCHHTTALWLKANYLVHQPFLVKNSYLHLIWVICRSQRQYVSTVLTTEKLWIIFGHKDGIRVYSNNTWHSWGGSVC